MLRTQASRPEHESNALNMTVMFRHVQACLSYVLKHVSNVLEHDRTWQSCCEHDFHVL